jgi:hypothetical protein
MHIKFDAETFDPRRLTLIGHDLASHPLFQFDALVALAKRLPHKQVRFHSTSAAADSDFERVEQQHPHHLGLDEAMANMETSGSWIALHNAQTDPIYKKILDEVLDEVNGRIDAKDPGMFNRAMWIFISSPNSVTPFHIDHEQNFLMQLRGKKHALLWHPLDVLDDHALEVFHSQWHRKEVKYSPSYDDVAQKYVLEPGQGVYMPCTAPHLVKNADNVSLTVSMTYCTNATRRTETTYRGKNALRKLGLTPAPLGASPVADAMTYRLYKTFLDARALAKGDRSDTPGWARF